MPKRSARRAGARAIFVIPSGKNSRRPRTGEESFHEHPRNLRNARCRLGRCRGGARARRDATKPAGWCKISGLRGTAGRGLESKVLFRWQKRCDPQSSGPTVCDAGLPVRSQRSGYPGPRHGSDCRRPRQAKVAELVDALDLGSSGATRESSSLSFRTTFE